MCSEETPLLQVPVRQSTPLPWTQLIIVILLQLSEPLTAQVINAFTPQLIRDVGVTHGDEQKVGYHVGVLQSLFYLTQGTTTLFWSGASDRIGRRPVIITGLSGLSVSMFSFGLSKTFWGVVLSRCLCGFLDGNSAVTKSIMVEITDSTNIAHMYSYMPIAWTTGGGIGPLIGGSLSHPAEQFPNVFGGSEFLKEHPYFLPCAVPAAFAVLTCLLSFAVLKETVKNPLPLTHVVPFRKAKQESGSGSASQDATAPEPMDMEQPLPFRRLLTPPVLIAAGNYASVSLVDMAFRAIQPLFFSMSTELGGLGLPPATIGTILSIYTVVNGPFHFLYFARMHERWGPKRVFMAGVFAALPAFGLFPVMSWLIRSRVEAGDTGTGAELGWVIWALVALQAGLSIGFNVSFGAAFVFVSSASPNRASLGATNGLSQMSVSFMRAVGPALATSLYSLSMGKGYLGGYLVYYILFALTCGACLIGSLLPHHLAEGHE